MKRESFIKRLLSVLLVVAMLSAWIVMPVSAEDNTKVSFTKVDNDSVSAQLPGREQVEIQEEKAPYADTDVVRVSIVLEKESTIAAGYATENIAANSAAMNYRKNLQRDQANVTAKIEKATSEKLDVAWNLTLAANIISANVEYGQIEAIEKVSGVKEVLIETQYLPDVVETGAADPNMATSSKQIGSTNAWAAGYTGAGMRVAIIDTGTDTDHQSFSNAGYNYSLGVLAGKAGMTPEEYKESLDLLDVAEIAAVADKLNAPIDAEEAYINDKIPFGYNYIDGDYDTTHDNDAQGEHGSHVSGIAAANAYIAKADGTFTNALKDVHVQGVAPDAQIITMKVFGKGGGAYDADYMAAIEDAIILGCDSVNLSLGSGNPGMSRNSTAEYQEILDSLTKSDTVVVMSAGNSGYWAENANNLGYLYSGDVSMQTNGSPGSFTNSLAVASVENDGYTGAFLTIGGELVTYSDTSDSGYSNAPMTSIAGEHTFVYIDAVGTNEEFAAVAEELEGNIGICNRGTTSFYEKGNAAVESGAIASIIVNNQPGVINMNLSDYKYTAPCVSVLQTTGDLLKAVAEKKTTTLEDGTELTYYVGKLTVASGVGSVSYDSEYYTMSSFSSWGVPGSLELKPEITAPGGNIYSVYGSTPDNQTTDAYEIMSGTSMAAPQVTGMMALVKQYIEEQGLNADGLTARGLAQSLLMSTAVPVLDGNNGGYYYPVIQQGAGLADVGAATNADSYLVMGSDATASYADGKIKAELGDDPGKKGVYSFSFSIHNLTDKDQVYALSADFFTQAPFLYYANGNMSMDELAYYMDTMTAGLDAATTFTVDGEPVKSGTDLTGMDFNGDEVVNELDGQALLDYATGARTELTNKDKADLDADGDIDSYDAYLFFTKLDTAAMVPANGSVNVTVTITLSDDDKAVLDAYFENGAYIEGYVFAEGVSSEEGVMGTSHSIPVLGFYGNWSDPSMFEVGIRPERVTGEEYRLTYLGNANINTYAVTYGNEPGAAYYFGGNPMVPDDTYMPERNAINSENGDSISKLSFAAIRNAAASRFYAKNVTTGETLAEALPGAVSSAYYYTNGATWRNTGYTLNVGFEPAGLAEGTKLELGLTLAPEYYVDAEGNVDWDAMGDGATLSVPMVVDNTAPEIEKVALNLTGNTLEVTASDNEYIAAVVLYNKSGTKLLSYTGAKQDIAAGESAEYVVDLSEVNSSKSLVQVVDYAMNVSTYLIEMQIGEGDIIPEMIAFDLNENQWISFTKDTDYEENDGLDAYWNSSDTIFAATIVDHLVFSATSTGDLYVMPENDFGDRTYIGNMGTVVTDMAYNKADGNIYGVDGYGNLLNIDKLTGEIDFVAQMPVETNTLACDANGTFYCNAYGTSEIYAFTLDTIAEPTLLATVENEYGSFESQYVQTMEINPNTGMLCWNSYYIELLWGIFEIGYSYYFEIDPATGDFTCYNDMWDELAGLIIPEKSTAGGDWSQPTDKITGIQLSETSLHMLRGGKETLTATVQPWTATDRTVTWTSSDESVATVDGAGNVTAVDAGTATITATSNLDPTISASCEVTVEVLNITLKGTLQDEDGNPMIYTWNMAETTTWTPGTALDTSMISATSNGKGTLYIMDGVSDVNAVHKVDEATGESVETYQNAAGLPMADMGYSPFFSTEEQDLAHMLYYYYFLPAKDPASITTSAFNFSSYLSQYTGGSEFVGITTAGSGTYSNSSGTHEAEYVILLDDAGAVWKLAVYSTESGFSAGISLYASNLLDEGYTLTYDSDYNPLTSMVMGDDGNLYVSAFNGDTNVLYRLSYNAATESYDAIRIGDVGDAVWPATLYEVTTNAPAEGNAFHGTADMEVSAQDVETFASKPVVEKNTMATVADVDNSAKESAATEKAAETVDTNAPVAGGLDSTVSTSNTRTPIMPLSDAVVGEGEETVTVNVTAKAADGGDTASTNGVSTVTYDPAALELVSTSIKGDYTSKYETDGSVTIGYVALDGIAAGESVATLTFKVKSTDAEIITVEHKEYNSDASGYTEELVLSYEHANTEVRDAKEATCTEDGYTGDTYCADCGKLLLKGEVIPATGHKTEVTGAKAATCTEDGYTGDVVCTVCGETIQKGSVIKAAGHEWDEGKVTAEATCEEEGVKTYTCGVCGETKTEAIEATGHNYTSVVTKPTATEKGYTTHTCENCGHSYVDSYTDPIGENVNTGDSFQTGLWISLLVFSFLGIAVLMVGRKKWTAR